MRKCNIWHKKGPNLKLNLNGYDVPEYVKVSSEAPSNSATNFATNFFQAQKFYVRKIQKTGVKKDPVSRVHE